MERGRHSPTTTDIIRTTGMSRPTVAKELIVLAELSMIERHDGLWQLVHATNLTSIAEWMGVQADYEEQRSLVKAQRRLWHAHLERHLVLVVYEEDLYDQERSEWDPWIPNDYGELNALERHLLAA